MCLNSNPMGGRNTAMITLNAIKADTVFGLNTAHRDGKNGFSPGAVFVICRPQPISMMWGENHGVPILQFGSAMKLVDVPASGLRTPYIPVNPTVRRIQGFSYDECILELTNINVGHTTCCGFLCDSIDMMTDEGNWRSGCPCYVVEKNTGYGIFVLSFNIKDKKSSEIIRSAHFTSRSFTNLMTSSGIPAGINPMMILRSGADFEIAQRLDELVEKINKNGGFRIIGWVRVGRVHDQAFKGAPSGEKQKTVVSGDLNYHITQILPNCDLKVFAKERVNIHDIYTKLVTRTPSGHDPSATNGSNHGNGGGVNVNGSSTVAEDENSAHGIAPGVMV